MGFRVAFILSLSLPIAAFAHGGHGGSHSAAPGATVHVHGYYRHDGTYVQGYDRAAPGQGTSRATSPAVPRETKENFRFDTIDDADGRVLVLHDGSLRRTKGDPEVQGRSVLFHDQQNRLFSVPTSAVDLATTRDINGRIKRSQAARRAFMEQTGYPNGRPGYIIDHKEPLECGGSDDPTNMQWQTIEDAKVKDRTEGLCRH